MLAVLRASIMLALTVVCAAACDDTPSEPAQAPVSATTASAPSEAVVSITVTFDEQPEEVVVTKAPRSLADVLPAAGRDASSWRQLSAKSADGKRTLAVRAFTEKYKDHDVRLYLDDKGRPTVGIFRRIRADMSAPVKAKLSKAHIVLVDAASVDVRTKEVARPDKETPPLVVSIDGVDKPLAKDKLSTLEMVAPPGDHTKGRRKKRGWSLRDVIGLVTTLSSVAHVKLVTAEEDSLMIQGRALVQEEIVVLLRYNKRGGLGISSYDSKTPGAPRRMRDVTKLIIASK